LTISAAMQAGFENPPPPSGVEKVARGETLEPQAANLQFALQKKEAAKAASLKLSDRIAVFAG